MISELFELIGELVILIDRIIELIVVISGLIKLIGQLVEFIVLLGRLIVLINSKDVVKFLYVFINFQCSPTTCNKCIMII